jgi:hypothetical protein
MVTKTILVAIKFGCRYWMEIEKGGEYDTPLSACFITHKDGQLKTIWSSPPPPPFCGDWKNLVDIQIFSRHTLSHFGHPLVVTKKFTHHKDG